MFLEAHFGDVTKPASIVPDGSEDDLLVMRVTVDNVVATVDLISMVSGRARSWGLSDNEQKVECESEELKARVEGVLEMALTTITPLSRLFAGQALEDQ
jgi:cleavage and polyadenylation specificity factor subunit 3